MQAWEEFLSYLESDLGTETVDKWLRSFKILKFDACNIYLEAKDSFQAMWFEEHVRQKALVKLVNNNKKRIKVLLSVKGSALPPPNVKKPPQKTSEAAFSAPKFSLFFDNLDPHCTFQNYSLTENRQFPWKLLSDLARNPHDQACGLGLFNPIYLYGPQGSGKTHLLMAVAEALNANGVNALYIRAETFTEHVVSAIRAGEMSQFRQAYRNMSVLIIDNVHVFSRKGATQEELFHTFNTLHIAGHQIILSANCSPAELQHIEPRLVSRFEWGIVLPLEAYSREELKLILEKKADALSFKLHPKVNDFLVETFLSSPHAIIKALKALILRSHMHNRDGKMAGGTILVQTAKALLLDLIQEEQQKAVTVDKILQAVSEYYSVRKEDILGTAQSREFVLPRQVAMYLCRKELKLPFMRIGDCFNKDHSTVIASVRLIEKALLQKDSDCTSSLDAIKNKLTFSA